MIVKNERSVIERCLNSVKPWIDMWVIADTGSTDGTQEIVRSCSKTFPARFTSILGSILPPTANRIIESNSQYMSTATTLAYWIKNPGTLRFDRPPRTTLIFKGRFSSLNHLLWNDHVRPDNVIAPLHPPHKVTPSNFASKSFRRVVLPISGHSWHMTRNCNIATRVVMVGPVGILLGAAQIHGYATRVRPAASHARRRARLSGRNFNRDFVKKIFIFPNVTASVSWLTFATQDL